MVVDVHVDLSTSPTLPRGGWVFPDANFGYSSAPVQTFVLSNPTGPYTATSGFVYFDDTLYDIILNGSTTLSSGSSITDLAAGASLTLTVSPKVGLLRGYANTDLRIEYQGNSIFHYIGLSFYVINEHRITISGDGVRRQANSDEYDTDWVLDVGYTGSAASALYKISVNNSAALETGTFELWFDSAPRNFEPYFYICDSSGNSCSSSTMLSVPSIAVGDSYVFWLAPLSSLTTSDSGRADIRIKSGLYINDARFSPYFNVLTKERLTLSSPDPNVEADAYGADYEFATEYEGYSGVAPVPFVITNHSPSAPSGAITLTCTDALPVKPTDCANWVFTGPNITYNAAAYEYTLPSLAAGASVTVYANPVDGLPQVAPDPRNGLQHAAAIELSAANFTNVSQIILYFSVQAGATNLQLQIETDGYSASDEKIYLTAIYQGDNSNLPVLSFKLTNAGADTIYNLAVNLSGNNSDAFDVIDSDTAPFAAEGPLILAMNLSNLAPGAQKTVQITPKADLLVGTYQTQMLFSYGLGQQKVRNIYLEVLPNPDNLPQTRSLAPQNGFATMLPLIALLSGIVLYVLPRRRQN